MILRPRPGYVPKVPTTPFRDQVVTLSLLCPVHALGIYLDRTQSFRLYEQLFVCFGEQQKGKAVSKERRSHWIMDAIFLTYHAQGIPCPLGKRAHLTRGLAVSSVLANDALLADICRAAGWATPNTSQDFIICTWNKFHLKFWLLLLDMLCLSALVFSDKSDP